MSTSKLLTPGKKTNHKQLPPQSIVSKRGVSSRFISWLLDGFKQMEPAKIKVRHQ